MPRGSSASATEPRGGRPRSDRRAIQDQESRDDFRPRGRWAGTERARLGRGLCPAAPGSLRRARGIPGGLRPLYRMEPLCRPTRPTEPRTGLTPPQPAHQRCEPPGRPMPCSPCSIRPGTRPWCRCCAGPDTPGRGKNTSTAPTAAMAAHRPGRETGLPRRPRRRTREGRERLGAEGQGKPVLTVSLRRPCTDRSLFTHG